LSFVLSSRRRFIFASNRYDGGDATLCGISNL
jgi:hypothetical protein